MNLTEMYNYADALETIALYTEDSDMISFIFRVKMMLSLFVKMEEGIARLKNEKTPITFGNQMQ